MRSNNPYMVSQDGWKKKPQRSNIYNKKEFYDSFLITLPYEMDKNYL